MHKPLIVATLAALALGGGMFARTAAAQTPCSASKQHCILVTVEKEASGDLKLYVDAPELRVKGAGHVIFWRLENAAEQNYKFASNGIAFKTQDGKDQFTNCGPVGSNGATFKCTDKNTIQDKFEYAITVSGSPAVPVLDPWIINR